MGPAIAVEDLRETIRLDVVGKAGDVTGLDKTLASLRLIKKEIGDINAMFSGLSRGRSAEVFRSGISSKDLSTTSVAKMFGLDPTIIREAGLAAEKEIRTAISRLNTAVAQGKRSDNARTANEIAALRQRLIFSSSAGSEFASRESAARFLESFESRQARNYRSIFRRTPTMANDPVGAHTAAVSGQIALVIPASQITATVVGQVPAVGSGGGGGGSRRTGSGSGGGGSGGAGAEARRLRALEEEAFRIARAGIRTGDAPALAAALRRHAGNVRAIPGPEGITQLYSAQADRFLAQSERLRQGSPQVGPRTSEIAFEKARERAMKESEKAFVEQERAAREHQRYFNRSSRQNLAVQKVWDRFSPPPMSIPPPIPPGAGGGGGILGTLMGGQGRLVTRGLTGFTLPGFARNVLTVGGWGAAVGTIGALTGVAGGSARAFVNLEQQTRRLDQVFRGAGGTAKALTDDVLALAAANGRSTEEAMDSAIAWSRLGLNRKQVQDGVRASLMAANVAEIDAGKATEHLSALMLNFNLRGEDMVKVLGQINNTSNKFRVTNKDIFEGLTRTATIAKDAGIPLDVLIPLIGIPSGVSGQAGAQFGNSTKAILSGLQNPVIQESLRSRFGFEVLSGENTLKPGAELLGELSNKYLSLESRGRGELLGLFGRNQANRIATALENYGKVLDQSADNLKNQDSAVVENTKIIGSIKSQWTGLTTEWIRFVNQAGSGGIGNRISTGIGAFSGGFRMMNAFGKVSFGDRLPPTMQAALAVLSRIDLNGNRMFRDLVDSTITETGEFDMSSRLVRFGSRLGLNFGAANDRMRAGRAAEFNQLGREQLSLGMAGGLQTLQGALPGTGGALNALFRRSGYLSALSQYSDPSRFNEQYGMEYSALSRPEVQGAARLADRRSIAARFSELTVAGVGYNEAERLLSRQKAIAEQLLAISQKRTLTDNDRVRQYMLELEGLKGEQAIQERLLQLKNEERQIALDSQKEFQLSLLTSSPSDLLRKMAVSSMSNGMNAGSFFGLSPAARADMEMLTGGQAMRQNRREQNALAPFGMDLETFQRFSENKGGILAAMTDGLMAAGQEFISTLGPAGEAAAAGMDRAAASAHAFADALDRASSSRGSSKPAQANGFTGVPF